METSPSDLSRARGARKTRMPCERCGLHLARCLCAEIPRLELRTRVSLVIHAKELKKTTNSGTLALAALPNSDLSIRGQTQERVDLSHLLDPAYQPLLFYPSEDAIELGPDWRAPEKPVRLIVPDGSWRQASKVHIRHPELGGIPRVMIRTPNLARHHLRAESSPYGMSTLEAIARAIEVIEGPDAGQALLALYRLKLERTLEGRGVRI